MQKANRGGLKKKAAAIAALLAVCATAVGGTFAYQDYKQHKSNELSGIQIKYEARLVEDFEEVPDWKVEDGPIKKEIRVANLGQAVAGYGDVYVRLQLKEFMQIGDIVFEETEERYMVAHEGQTYNLSTGTFTFEDGHYVVFPSQTLAKEAFPNSNVKYLEDIVTGDKGWFIETQKGDINGQYGKHVVTAYTPGDMEPVIPGSVFCPENERNHHGVKDPTTGVYDIWSKECAYPIHTWDDPDGPEYREYIKAYIEWVLGGDVIFMSAWDGTPVAAWIIDETDPMGWAYWGQALEPGETTSNLLEKVTLINQPDGNFYYVIHTDMQALSIDEFIKEDGAGKDWADKPKDSYVKNRPTITFNGTPAASVRERETVNSPSVTVGPAGAAQSPLTWTSSRPDLATVDQNGIVTGVKAGGPVTIIVRAPNGARGTYTLMVTPGDPVDIPGKSVAINGGDRTLNIGQGETLTITKDPADTTDTPVWTTSDPNKVTVDQNGKIKGIAEGTATITVTLRPGVTDSITVTVSPNAPQQLPLKPDDDGSYKARHDGSNFDNEFGMKVDIIRSTFTVDDMEQPCAIKLKDILDIADYSGITVRAKDSSLNQYFTIGTDKTNVDKAILCTYIGVKADWEAVRPQFPTFNIPLILSKEGYADTEITVEVSISIYSLYM